MLPPDTTRTTATLTLDGKYPGLPAWADDGDRLAATIYEDDGKPLIVTTGEGEDWPVAPISPEHVNVSSQDDTEIHA